MAGAGRESDQHGRIAGSRIPGCVEGHPEPSQCRGAGGVLARDIDLAACPGVAQVHEGWIQMVVQHSLEASHREDVVQRAFYGRPVDLGRGLHQPPGRLGGRSRVDGLRSNRRRLGSLGLRRDDVCRGLTRRPSIRDQRAHRSDTPNRGIVIDPIPRLSAQRHDDAVAALPCAQQGDADARPLRGLLDRVHAVQHTMDKQLTMV